jgi:protease secretion system membrane fusion protein
MQSLKSSGSLKSDQKNNLIEGESFQNLTYAPVRWGVWVLVIGFVGFFVWACFAPLNEGVPTTGTVSIDTKRKVVQHLSGGIVKSVMVKEGELVKAGQILLTLDDTNTKARFEEIRQHYLGLRAREGRLTSEQKGVNTIQIHSDLQKSLGDYLVEQQLHNQEMLLISRRGSLDSVLQGIEESIQGKEAAIRGSEAVLESRKVQKALLTEQIKGLEGLVNEGYAPKNQLQDIQLRLAQTHADIADSQSSIAQSKRAIAEMRQRALTQKQEYHKEVDTQMAEVKLEVDANADKLKAATEELGRMEVRSPVSGQVVGLQFQTIGSVIQSGQRIMDVVPVNEVLMLEVKIPPNLIDRIHTQQKADIRFSSFSNSPLLKVEGLVDSVSYDLLTDNNTGSTENVSYYLARVSITPKGIKTLGQRIMQSGMPAQVIIKTGERSLLTYLLHPFMKRLSASMKEE